MKNILVTGGAGFIGSHLVRRLLATPGVENVLVIDSLVTGRRENLPADERVTLWERPLESLTSVYPWRPDTVFHLAANADIAKAVDDPTVDFYQGTELTQRALEIMRMDNIHRIFYTSGSGVYGDWGIFPVTELCHREPISPYGASKLASEAMISAYSHMFGIKASVFRFANVVGPRQTHGVGYDFIRRLREDPLLLEAHGDGTQSKSYVHVEDVLDAMMLVAAKQTADYDVWNVSSEGHDTVREIAQLAAEIMGLQPEFSFGSGNRGWRGDVPVVRFDCSKIKALGWSPKLTSRQAMAAALLAMREETAP